MPDENEEPEGHDKADDDQAAGKEEYVTDKRSGVVEKTPGEAPAAPADEVDRGSGPGAGGSGASNSTDFWATLRERGEIDLAREELPAPAGARPASGQERDDQAAAECAAALGKQQRAAAEAARRDDGKSERAIDDGQAEAAASETGGGSGEQLTDAAKESRTSRATWLRCASRRRR